MDTWQGQVNNPITLNKYLYANGNPVMYTDPSGEMTIAGIMAGINGQANMQNRRTRNAVTKVKDMATTLCKNISQLAGKFDDHHAFPVFLGGTRKHGHTGDVFVDEYVHSILHGLMGQMFILNGLPHPNRGREKFRVLFNQDRSSWKKALKVVKETSKYVDDVCEPLFIKNSRDYDKIEPHISEAMRIFGAYKD